jgi:hypothetical protein
VMSIGSLVVVLYMVKHVGNMFDKLGVANRTQAVSRASHGVGAAELQRACRSRHRCPVRIRETPPRRSTFG